MTKKFIVGGLSSVQRHDLIGLCNGMMAGCVVVTACCDRISPWAAFVVGIIASFTYSFAVRLMDYL